MGFHIVDFKCILYITMEVLLETKQDHLTHLCSCLEWYGIVKGLGLPVTELCRGTIVVVTSFKALADTFCVGFMHSDTTSSGVIFLDTAIQLLHE